MEAIKWIMIALAVAQITIFARDGKADSPYTSDSFLAGGFR
jgi:hypothetical protein